MASNRRAAGRRHRVVVLDYRGAGGSPMPDDGYDKATMARDVHAVMLAENLSSSHVVGHDIGMPVAYAYARQFPGETSTLALLDGVIPGTAFYQASIASGRVWHFGFSAEVEFATKLLAGREDIYFDRIFDDHTLVKSAIGPDERALCLANARRHGGLARGLKAYAAFAADAVQNQEWMASQGRLEMPVLVAGGSGSLGPTAMATASEIASDPHVAVIEGAGQFIAEERPEALAALLRTHFERGSDVRPG